MERMIVVRGSVAVLFVVILVTITYLHNGFCGLFQTATDDKTAASVFQPAQVCENPFVHIGNSCYFFSGRNMPVDYHKIQYKGGVYSVPIKLDWLHTLFGCEALDRNAKPICLETEEEMQAVADYMSARGYPYSYNFWSAGHRSKMSQMAVDATTINDFYWHFSLQPMNFTNWLTGQPNLGLKFPEGFCVNLQLVDKEIIMSTVHCDFRLPYVCELEL